MRLQTIVIFILTLAGFALRLHYATSTHPFFDEYTTVLAARQILREGWPILPSGLFYEHGLLATYLIAPFTALFINSPVSEWQPAHWGLMLSRWPNVLIGTATIPLVYVVGICGLKWWSITSHRLTTYHLLLTTYHTPIALLAAGLFALSPEGMVWGGRARMYALATMLVLLTVYWAYRGAAYPGPAKYRWLAMFTLLATLLTQFGAMMLVPALVISMLIIGRLSWRTVSTGQKDKPFTHHASRITHHEPRTWFLRPMVLLEGTALTAIIGIAVLVKRLGRPLGTDALNNASSGNTFTELLNTITYQTALYFTWSDTIKFLSRQFGVPHHFWLILATIVGAVIGLIYWLIQKRNHSSQSPNLPISQSPNLFIPFLWLTFGLIILEMITLLESFRRNPRYIVMYLPLFYLMAAHAIFNFRYLPRLLSKIFGFKNQASGFDITKPIQITIAIGLLILLTVIGFNDLRIALGTPEPAYEEAFAYVQDVWQPGDTLLTMNTPAAGLFFGQVDGFTVQADADQFLLNAGTAPVDRWLGTPWVGSMIDFNAALNAGARTWFVIDTIRRPVYFRGDWQAVVNSQMEQVWANDNAIIYRTRPDRIPLPTRPDSQVNATLDQSIRLAGYSLQIPNSQLVLSEATNEAPISNPSTTLMASLQSPISNLQLTFFWYPLTPLPTDYTTFLHLRNSEGVTVAQQDSQPLNGAYPTSRWQPGETVIDPVNLSLPDNLPAGTYTLFTGLYRLDTLERLPVAGDTSGENAIPLGEITLP